MRPVVRAVRAAVASMLAVGVVCAHLALGQAPPPIADAEVGAVRVLRIGTDDRPHDVWLGGTRVAAELGRGAPSGYVVVPAGPSDVGLAASGDEASAGPSSVLGEVDVPAAAYATLIVSGANASDTDGAASDQRATEGPVLIEDPLTDLPPAGRAGLRLLHVAPGLPALTLAARSFEAPPGERRRDAADPPGEASHVARVDPMRGSAHAPVEAGLQRLWLVREDGTQVLSAPLEIALRAGALYTLVVAPGPSASARVSVAVDASSTAADGPDGEGPSSLRVLHASPDAPLVDVLVDGVARLRDVAPGTLTLYTSVTTGTHLLEVYPHRLPSPMTDPGRSTESGGASRGDGADAGEGATAGGTSAGSASVPRLEPVTALVDVPEGRYTTLVLAGRYQPAASTAETGGLSVSVEPADASVTVQGPEGDVVAGQPGPKLLDGLAPGTYRVEVRKAGYRSARYEVEVSPDATAVLSVTLQRSQGASGGGDDPPAGDDGQQEAGPDLSNLSAPQAERRSLELHVYPSAIPIADPGAALVRIVHAAPSVPHLDVVASRPSEAEDADGADGARTDGAVASLEGLAYPNASAYVRIGAGTVVLTFRVAGSENRLRRLEIVELRPGTSYSLFLVARSPSLRFSVVPTVDAIAPQRRLEPGGR